jgi:mannosyltransferase OCH1-like enzyme
MIPKKIHYCWLSNDPIPDNLCNYINTWKEILSDYEFVLWNFNKFDINSSKWVKQAFEAKKYAFAADFIRLHAVYNYGGIYLDMDIEIIKPFDDLLQNNIMLAYEDNKTKNIEAACFGAEKGHPFIKMCLEYFIEREFNLKIIDEGYTLPRIMKKIYEQHEEFKLINLYQSDFFTAKNFRTGVIRKTENTYSVHHFAGSWLSEQDKINHKTMKKIVLLFGDSSLSVFIILCIAFINRIKKHGFYKTIVYYIKLVFK